MWCEGVLTAVNMPTCPLSGLPCCWPDDHQSGGDFKGKEGKSLQTGREKREKDKFRGKSLQTGGEKERKVTATLLVVPPGSGDSVLRRSMSHQCLAICCHTGRVTCYSRIRLVSNKIDFFKTTLDFILEKRGSMSHHCLNASFVVRVTCSSRIYGRVSNKYTVHQ